jgi:hypothetical protein
MGFIKFYVLSSEHDLSSQSVQGRFIRNAVLNSKKYSWNFLVLHRPLNDVRGDIEDHSISLMLLNYLIDILSHIDVVFTGHQHMEYIVKNSFFDSNYPRERGNNA